MGVGAKSPTFWQVHLFRLLNPAVTHLGLVRHRTRRADGELATGSAVVLCEIRRHRAVRTDTLIVVESRFGRVGRASIRLLHRIVATRTDELVAQAEVTQVFFDMVTRRPVALPHLLRLETGLMEV